MILILLFVGAMKVTPYLDRNNRPKIDYFVVPDSFMETLILKNSSKIKSTFNSVDVAIKYGFDIQKLKKIILGMTIFGGYQGAEPSPEVDLEERLKFFKEQLKFDYDNLKQGSYIFKVLLLYYILIAHSVIQ